MLNHRKTVSEMNSKQYPMAVRFICLKRAHQSKVLRIKIVIDKMAKVLASLTNDGIKCLTEAELENLKLFEEYPDGLMKFASVCCVLFILIGIPGNLVTVIALARCKKVSVVY